MTYWISARLPTQADGDEDGEVVICSEDGVYWWMDSWKDVKAGQPWIRFVKPGSSAAAATATTTSPEPGERRFVSLLSHNSALIAIADDGTAWIQRHASDCDWHRLRALPPR